MSTEQQRKMLECAAKACGITGAWQEGFGICVIGDYLKDPGEQVKFWNPIAIALDTAEMCALLGINTTYWWGAMRLNVNASMSRSIRSSLIVEFMRKTTTTPA